MRGSSRIILTSHISLSELSHFIPSSFDRHHLAPSNTGSPQIYSIHYDKPYSLELRMMTITAASRGVSMRLLRPTNRSRSNMYDVRRKGTTFSTGSNGRRSFWYPVIGGIAITTAGGVKYVHDHVGGTEGLTRSLSFYR
jgi:hypothetical protein